MNKPVYEEREIAYEDQMAGRYNRDYHDHPIMQQHDEDFAAYVLNAYRPGDRILDLGCGPASHWKYWKQYLSGHGTLIGVDLSEGMICEARRLYPEDDFRVGSGLKLPLEDGSIDLVIASSVLHHIPDSSLPAVFTEVSRVLDEHGTIVGREPVSRGRLGDVDGWLSGAIMMFRHLVYRLTGTREYPEPENGDHHHAYDPEAFIGHLKNHFSPKGITFRHPLSLYIARCDHPLVAKIARTLDEALQHRSGQEFFYTAVKNFADAGDVAYCVEQELKQNEMGIRDKKAFLALLQQAAILLEEELKK